MDGKKCFYTESSGKKHQLKGTETVSMNMWGFMPGLFGQLDGLLKSFLREKGQEEKSEFLIPRVIDELVHRKKARVKVLSTKDQWFGVTYPQDKDRVRENMEKMIRKKVYPARLIQD